MTAGAEEWYNEMMDGNGGGYGYQRPKFEFGMCTYDTSDAIRRFVGANRRKYMLPNGDMDQEAIKMLTLTCMSASVASRLEAAAGMDCRARDANAGAAAVIRDFLDAATTWQEALLGFERLLAPPDAVANACEVVEAIKHKPWNGGLIRTTTNMIEKARGRARGTTAPTDPEGSYC